MGLFWNHQHRWLPIRVNKISADADDRPCVGEIITQECRCGAVRTITIEPGRAPIIREAPRAETVGPMQAQATLAQAQCAAASVQDACFTHAAPTTKITGVSVTDVLLGGPNDQH